MVIHSKMAPAPFCPIADTRILVGSRAFTVHGKHADTIAKSGILKIMYARFDYATIPTLCGQYECCVGDNPFPVGWQIRGSQVAAWNPAAKRHGLYGVYELGGIPPEFGTWYRCTALNLLVRVGTNEYVEAQLVLRHTITEPEPEGMAAQLAEWVEENPSPPRLYAFGFEQYGAPTLLIRPYSVENG